MNCANPKCGQPFPPNPNGGRKLCCSRSCNDVVQAARRLKANHEAQTMQAPTTGRLADRLAYLLRCEATGVKPDSVRINRPGALVAA